VKTDFPADGKIAGQHDAKPDGPQPHRQNRQHDAGGDGGNVCIGNFPDQRIEDRLVIGAGLAEKQVHPKARKEKADDNGNVFGTHQDTSPPPGMDISPREKGNSTMSLIPSTAYILLNTSPEYSFG
jgi:hypothetical protein